MTEHAHKKDIAETYGAQFFRLIPQLVLSAAIGFGAAWWNSQLTQNDLRNRLERLEEKSREAAIASGDASKVALDNALRMERMNVTLDNVVQQMRDIEAEHRRRQDR